LRLGTLLPKLGFPARLPSFSGDASLSTTPAPLADKFTFRHWLIVIVASIGFLFDTYELLMFPVIAKESLAELLQKPEISPEVTDWTGYLLWMAALSGGIFGLLGGWLIDRFGRRTVMIGSIMIYSFSPVLAAFSTNVWMFAFFRCATFVGVCVEFVAAVTWLSELFPDKRRRELVVGWTLAISSLGGVFVTEMFNFIGDHRQEFPSFHIADGFDSHATWRYTLLTGLIPGMMIAALLPFVPESKVWRERKQSGTLGRPSFLALFAPGMLRVTLVTAALSACAYAAAFGALQLTPSQVATGLPEFVANAGPIRKEIGQLDKKIEQAPKGSDAAKALLDEKKEKANALKLMTKERIGITQRWQEIGGLVGRIILAMLLIFVASRRTLLRIFQIPGIIILPLTYFYFFSKQPNSFMIVYFFASLFTIAQFSYFGEYLPKVFPIHLRGTGGAFATNVGGRMIGTMAAPLVTGVLAPLLRGGDTTGAKETYIALGAGIVGTSVFVIGFLLSFFLPEPHEDPAAG
jgi:MFS family permease